jgi:Tetracyclin repressor-like, C-terminal domain
MASFGFQAFCGGPDRSLGTLALEPPWEKQWCEQWLRLKMTPLAATHAQFMQARFEAAGIMIDWAAARGELRSGIDRQLALELLSAPLYFRKLVSRQPIDDRFVEQVVDTLLRGMAK